MVAAVNSVDENGDGVVSCANLARKQLDDGMCIGQTDFFAEYYERTNVAGIASASRTRHLRYIPVR